MKVLEEDSMVTVPLTSAPVHADALKDLLAPLPTDRESAGWLDPAESASYKLAAVLVPLVVHHDSTSLLLTRRTKHLHNHAGQISFPGGGAEDSDESPVQTALRETEEEIGLGRHHIEPIGTLPEHYTTSGFRVTPVVGLVRPPFDLTLDTFEVVESFEVPITHVLDPANQEENNVFVNGRLHAGYAFPFNGHYIWGMTAAVIMSLCEVLQGGPRTFVAL